MRVLSACPLLGGLSSFEVSRIGGFTVLPHNCNCCYRSNSLFSLWNKYQHRLSLEFLSTQLLKAADLFYEAGLYHLARTQGYRRCLERVGLLKGSEGEDKGIFEDYVSSCGNKAVTVNIVSICEVYRLVL